MRVDEVECFELLPVCFRILKVISVIVSFIIIAVNTFFVQDTLREWDLSPFPLTVVLIVAALYLLFCLYLAVHLAVFMGNKTLAKNRSIQKYFLVQERTKYHNQI